MDRPRVEVLCIGTELLSGKVNTHVSWLGGALAGIGLSIAREATLSDSIEEIETSMRDALERSRIVIVCGGLGPTFDDVTREGASRAVGRPLRYHPALYARIRARLLRHYKRRVPPENRRQAYILTEAEVLPNAHGSAPGQFLQLGPKSLILLPGPGWELKPMFEALLARLKALHAPNLVARKTVFHLCGLTESEADERLGTVIAKAGPHADLTILAGHGQVDFHVSATGASASETERRLSRIRRLVERAVDDCIFGRDAATLESVVGAILTARKMTLATAESCTAGLLSARITAAPGSSRYYRGGVAAYANEVKTAQLGVDPGLIQRHGAVSAACAEAMAQGAVRTLKTDIGVSITGIAGPDGGTRAKPVGLVFIAIARKNRPPMVQRHLFSGNRDMIRERASAAALALLWKTLA